MIGILIIAGASFFQPQAQVDSIGIETVNGKTFVIHKVGEKETLYALSKRYGTTVDAILQYNPTADAGLEIGQILKVPYVPRRIPATVRPAGGITHVVAAKETMFSISKAYNVSVDEIRQWNNLPDNSLSIGQELTIKRRNTVSESATVTQTSTSGNGTHTVAAKETMYSITRQYGITVQQLKEWNSIDGNELKIGQVLTVVAPTSAAKPTQETVVVSTVKTTPPPVEQQPTTSTNTTPPVTTTPKVDTQPQTIRITESANNDEVLQTGIAELIEGTEGNRKYLALHRTAPVGTILKVKNEMNNREVFVRVMGKLPDTALTDKLIIKISKSAYDRLGAIDPRFRVEVTYYK